ncbi:MAG: HAD family hydrolase [Gemmatimonadota bacterium]|nr:HAD family hydrolase [Gemmatimonadota bacterium]
MPDNYYSAVLFDLDGTLLDTIPELAASMNAVLTHLGLPAHNVEAYKYHVGDGIETLARRVLPAYRRDETTIRQCVAGMRDEYESRWAVSRAYDGISDLLNVLAGRGVTMVVLSNKPDDFTKKVIGALLPDYHFERIVGATSAIPEKPDPTGALKIASELHIAPRSFLYVGDTDTDMKTAVAAGMYPVGALWGFRTADELASNGAKTLIAHPMDLIQLL